MNTHLTIFDDNLYIFQYSIKKIPSDDVFHEGNEITFHDVTDEHGTQIFPPGNVFELARDEIERELATALACKGREQAVALSCEVSNL